MQELDIPLRTQKEARELAYDRNKISYTITDENGNERLITQGGLRINRRFFTSWSREMAYVLGVIYTDGDLYSDPVRKSYRFGVSQKEPELLNKVLRLMDCNARLCHTKKRGIAGELYRFAVQNKEMYAALIDLGLSPNKSKTMEFPNVPQEFVRDFIRGCWDGDGSIYFESPRKLRGSYTCGSLNFIERLVQELYKAGIYKRKPPLDETDADRMRLNYPDGRFPLRIHQEPRSKSYYIKVDTRENLERLFHYLYDGVEESLYLSRKYAVFVRGLKIQETRDTQQLTLDLPS
jgi:hypothetical protein